MGLYVSLYNYIALIVTLYVSLITSLQPPLSYGGWNTPEIVLGTHHLHKCPTNLIQLMLVFQFFQSAIVCFCVNKDEEVTKALHWQE